MRERMGVAIAVPAALAVVAAGGVGFGAYMLNERNAALEQLGHQAELGGSIATLETRLAGLAARSKEGEEALAAARSQLEGAEAELLTVRTEHDRLAAEVGPMREEIAGFDTRRDEAEKAAAKAVADFGAAETRLKELTAREDALRATVTGLAAEVQDLDRRMEGLRAESGQLVAAAQAAERQRSDLQGMVEMLAEVLATRGKELVDLEHKIGTYELKAPTEGPADSVPAGETGEAAPADGADAAVPETAGDSAGAEASTEPAPAEPAPSEPASDEPAAAEAPVAAPEPEAAAPDQPATEAAPAEAAAADVPDLGPGSYAIGPLEVTFASNGRFTMRNTELGTMVPGRWRVEDGQLTLLEPKGVSSSSSFPMICRMVATDDGIALEKPDQGACPLAGQVITRR